LCDIVTAARHADVWEAWRQPIVGRFLFVQAKFAGNILNFCNGKPRYFGDKYFLAIYALFVQRYEVFGNRLPALVKRLVFRMTRWERGTSDGDFVFSGGGRRCAEG